MQCVQEQTQRWSVAASQLPPKLAGRVAASENLPARIGFLSSEPAGADHIQGTAPAAFKLAAATANFQQWTVTQQPITAIRETKNAGENRSRELDADYFTGMCVSLFEEQIVLRFKQAP